VPMLSQRFTALLLFALLSIGIAACAPTAEVANDNTANNSAVVEESNDDTAEVQFVAPANIAPDAYVAEYRDGGADHILIDVREPYEFDSGHIAGAVNIPLGELSNRLSEVPAETQVIVYCRSGNRSTTAANVLANAGYSGVLNLGGVIGWQASGYPLQ
jgi:rhodanese-related sulfurtransferase